MNAVNWLKRRVSLSTTPSSSILSPNPHSQNNLQPISERHHQQHQQSTNPTAFNSDRNAKGTPLNTSGRSVNSTPSSGQYLAQHDIIDPSSPLSLLAATSKLTTFPYGELQALNARKTQQTNKSNSITTNGVKNVVGVNGTGSTGHQNNVVSAIPKPLSRPKRQRVLLSTTTRQPTAKLLPSPIPQSTSTAGGEDMSEFQVPTPPSSQMDNHKRNATTSAVILRQRPQSKHNKSESLSSIQNTRSKRQKTSHPTTIPTIPDLPPLPKQPLPFHATRAPKTPPPTAPSSSTDGKQKRILPVRQGQVDILDGEISLLSTPQRLDNRPSFEPTHKVILVDDLIPSTPTTRYEPFSPTSIPDPNTSPTTIRPKSIAAPIISLRSLPKVACPRSDPLPDALYVKPHRKHEFTEIRLRNREREKIDYEASELERQLQILKSEDWRKHVAPAAAEREALKQGEEWDWEGRRARRIELLEGVLRRVRTWRDAEIKLRKGMMEKKPLLDEQVKIRKRKRIRSEDGNEEGASPVSIRKSSIKEEQEEETNSKEVNAGEEGKDGEEQESKKTRWTRKPKAMAFGQEIPKAGLRNREFQIPVEWVPEEKRL